MKTRVALVLLTVCTLVFMGCPREDSCLIRTEGIYFAFRVVEEDGVATVSAVFSVGNALGTELALGNCGDDVTCNGIALQEQIGAFVYYEAIIDLADTYEFVFTREGETPYVSTVSPAPLVTIASPVDADEISRQDAFDITWEDNYELSPGITLFISGQCIQEILRDIGDNGFYTINADEIVQANQGGNCDVNLSLTRLVEGDLDPALQGFVRARTRDTVWFTSTP